MFSEKIIIFLSDERKNDKTNIVSFAHIFSRLINAKNIYNQINETSKNKYNIHEV